MIYFFVVILASLAAASQLQAVGPLTEGTILAGQMSFSPEAAVSPPALAHQMPASVPPLEGPARAHGVPQDNFQRKIPAGFFHGNQGVNHLKLRRDKEPFYVHPGLYEKMTPAGKCKEERVCRESSTRGLKGHLKGMRLIHALPVGTKVERLTISLKLRGIEEIISFSEKITDQKKEELRALKNQNLKALKRIKDLEIEHLEVELDIGNAESVQRVLEWVEKNPYGEMKSVSVKSHSTIFGVKDTNLYLPSPAGTKIYPQKKLQAFSIDSRRISESINSGIVEMMGRSSKMTSLCLNGKLEDFSLDLEIDLEALVKRTFPTLKSLSICSYSPVLREIGKALWASQLTSLHVSAARMCCLSGTKILLGSSWDPFPALESLKLSCFQSKDKRFGAALQSVPELRSFHAYDCEVDPLKFSDCLQRLSGGLVDLNLEDVRCEGKAFYRLPSPMAERLRSLTLKKCGAQGENLEHFFSSSTSFVLHSLDLSENGIEMREFENVFLKKFLNLKNLNLSRNPLGNDGADFLIRNRTNFPNLERLTLSKCFFKPLLIIEEEHKEKSEVPYIVIDEEEPKPLLEVDYGADFKKAFPKIQIFWQED